MNYSIPPLTNLFLDAFGVNIGGIYRPEAGEGLADDPTTKAPFYGVKYVDDKEVNQISGLGTPIIYPITFTNESIFQKYKQDGSIDTKVQMGNFRLPISCIADFERSKNIGVTKINGSKTSVKEMYGFNDWNITINGFFLYDSSQPQGLYQPQQQEKEMLSWDDLACSIPVDSIPFNNLGIGHITITDIRINPFRGKPNIRAFTIKALSDEAIELNIKSQV